MGDINGIKAAAEDLAAKLKAYDLESMHQLVRDMPGLGTALADVAGGLHTVASRAESEWPVAQPVADALYHMASDMKAVAGVADEVKATVRKENETDVERGEAPRKGSREIESKWDVGRAE